MKPLKGHPYHNKTEAELRFIIKDAGEAAQAVRGLDEKAEGKYLDQVNDACTVLGWRRASIGVYGLDQKHTDAVNEARLNFRRRR